MNVILRTDNGRQAVSPQSIEMIQLIMVINQHRLNLWFQVNQT